MEFLLTYIEELAVLEPLLVPIAKFSLVILICIVAYLPIAILALLVGKAFRAQLVKATDYLNYLKDRLDYLSRRVAARARQDLNLFYKTYNSIIPLEVPAVPVSNNAVQEALNNFERDLEAAPELASDREAKKAKLVEQLNDTLNQLQTGSVSLREIDIPELELDTNHSLRKRAAKSTLIIFLPLLLAVVAVNTVLLNTFFDELLDGLEIFDIPYAIVIALMFTLIETGVGVVFGFQEREIERGEQKAGNYVTFAFGWLIIIGLGMVEFFLYLLVGTSMSDLDAEEVKDGLIDGLYLELFLAGGWLSLLGPTIVLGLYIFGHRVSTAFFDFIKESDLERFKIDLDERYDLFSSLKAGINEFSDKIDQLLSRIQNENTQLNKAKAASSSNLDAFRNIFQENMDRVMNAVTKAAETEAPIPEIQTAVLNREDTTSFHRSNLVYLLMLIASFIVLAISLPAENSGLLPFSMTGGVEFLVALILCGLAISSGVGQSSEVTVVQTSDGQVARIIIEPKQVIKVAGSVVIGFLAVFLLYLLNGGSGILKTPAPFILGLLCLSAGYVTGKRLLVSISSWRAYTWFAGSAVKSGMFQVASFFIGLMAVTISMINPTLDGLSYPVRMFSKRSS